MTPTKSSLATALAELELVAGTRLSGALTPIWLRIDPTLHHFAATRGSSVW